MPSRESIVKYPFILWQFHAQISGFLAIFTPLIFHKINETPILPPFPFCFHAPRLYVCPTELNWVCLLAWIEVAHAPVNNCPPEVTSLANMIPLAAIRDGWDPWRMISSSFPWWNADRPDPVLILCCDHSCSKLPKATAGPSSDSIFL